MPLTVGFIGFGEVARTFAPAMLSHGVEVAAYDIAEHNPADSGVTFRPLAELAARSDYLLSAVTTPAALSAAISCLPHLRPGQAYVDLNSTSPAVKVELDRVVRAAGARFVEGAILGAVGVSGAATRILIGGADGREVADVLAGAGLRTSFYSPEIGKASAFKLLRSIFSKGLEVLILEMLIAGRRAGIEQDLWADVVEWMTAHPFQRVAGNWVETHPSACGRRHHEMLQVTALMREIGLTPVMAAATEAFFDRSRALGLEAAFPARAASVEDVVARLDESLR